MYLNSHFLYAYIDYTVTVWTVLIVIGFNNVKENKIDEEY